MRGATAAGSALPGPPCNFNPRAPCGARLVLVGTAYLAWSFQSTRPMRGATEHPESQRQFQPFQSTRPMRGATYSWPEWRALRLISIHAPHAGRDFDLFRVWIPIRISIHAPHAGRDAVLLPHPPGSPDFNPRAPCGARPPPRRPCSAGSRCISIHAPHAGRDGNTVEPFMFAGTFQSTRPMRGATSLPVLVLTARPISIHAPHAGRDTAPASHCIAGGISIHAPHAGRDPPGLPSHPPCAYFNPRAPCGARLSITIYR